MKSFYWHDYETWGTNPAIDRPSQFAGVRTDENLNIIGDPLVMYCQPPEDIWPQPLACMVTGITPQLALQEGLPEHAFIKKIHREFSQPGTCGVGYNSLRFDDEVTRYALYRNFYDPYEREWRNGNSRWDIIDMVRLAYALRPEGIEWPIVDGRPSFRLENLTVANNIAHQSAHDAYSDVEATIEMAKLVRSAQPDLYQYALANKTKQKVAAMMDVANKKPLLHISSRFSAEHGCAALIVPLSMHPTNKNAVVVYDLSIDPTPLLTLDADAIAERVFTATADLPEGVARIPLKLVHINRCPILVTPKLLDEKAAQRLNIDKALCERHWRQLRESDLSGKLELLYTAERFSPRKDPEQQLYNGFLNGEDKKQCAVLRKAKLKELAEMPSVFNDTRLNQMLLRYKARNFPEALNEQERLEWHEHVQERLMQGEEGCLSYSEYLSVLDTLALSEDGASIEKQALISALRQWGEQKTYAF
ncbi:exodeoxyribonuclease I [Teredinibacter purpureus]|uniref:exodeoxyribonuclease I n=1 Tax=Teredinibacter purpureus TaxID=2731756 RepID=UPI0005F86209|nr:exodeoxyribonuclease I [Teredinibacter purpureus]